MTNTKLLDLLIQHDANDPDVLAKKIEALYVAAVAARLRTLAKASGDAVPRHQQHPYERAAAAIEREFLTPGGS